MVCEEVREVDKRNEVLRLLSQAWLVYAENYPDGKNFERLLEVIFQAQLAVFEED